MRTLKTIVIQCSIVFVLLSIVSLNGFGQSSWQKAYGTTRNDYPRQMIRISDGGYLLTGESYVQSADIYTTGYLVKTKSNGDTSWTKRLFPSDSETSVFANSVYELNSNSFIIGGGGDKLPNGKYNFILEIDSNGSVVWCKKHYTYRTYTILDVLSNNDVVFSDGYLLGRMDTTGTLDWKIDYPTYFTPRRVIRNHRRNFCYIYYGAGGVYYREINPSGQIIKDQLFGVGSGVATGALIQDSEHNFIEVNPTADSKILHAAKFDTTLNILWDKTYSSLSVGVNVNALVQTVEGGYVMIGQFFNDPEGDICFFKIDKEGNKEYFTWLTRFGREEKAIDAYGDSDGGIVFFGYGDEGPQGGVDLLLAKVNSEGTMGVPFLSYGKELQLTLYPNPTQNYLQIKSKENLNGIIQIYQLDGICILENKISNKDSSEVDVQNLSSGIYVVKVTDDMTGSFYCQKFIKK